MCHPIFYHMHFMVQRDYIKMNIPTFSYVPAFKRAKKKLLSKVGLQVPLLNYSGQGCLRSKMTTLVKTISHC